MLSGSLKICSRCVGLRYRVPSFSVLKSYELPVSWILNLMIFAGLDSIRARFFLVRLLVVFRTACTTIPMQEYALAGPARGGFAVDTNLAPASWYLGVMGTTGATAWLSFHDICAPQAGETLVISSAGSAVGTVVAQLAKQAGCRVDKTGICISSRASKFVRVNIRKHKIKFPRAGFEFL